MACGTPRSSPSPAAAASCHGRRVARPTQDTHVRGQAQERKEREGGRDGEIVRRKEREEEKKESNDYLFENHMHSKHRGQNEWPCVMP